MFEWSRLVFARNLANHFQIVFVLVNELSLFTQFCQLIFFASSMFFLAFALSCLKEFRFVIKGTFLNLRTAAFRSLIAILHLLLNQSVLRLFEDAVFGIVSFAIAINVTVKCYIRSVLFESWNSLLLHKGLNCCQSALFVSQQEDLLLSLIGCVIFSIMGKWSLPQGSSWPFHI